MSNTKITKKLRKALWDHYMVDPNSAIGKCTGCEKQIHILEFKCLYQVKIKDDGVPSVDNVKPVCATCLSRTYRRPPAVAEDSVRCKHVLISGDNKGQQCTEIRFEGHEYCQRHLSRKSPCTATCRNGQPCSNLAKKGGELCSIHARVV